MQPRSSRLYQYSLALVLLAVLLLPARAEASGVRLGDLVRWGGIAWEPERPDTPVLFVEMPHGGVACAAVFREVAGNVQHLCPEGFEGILVHRNTSWDRLAHVLFHEHEHLLRGPDGPAHDRFNEALIDRLSCEAFPVAECAK